MADGEGVQSLFDELKSDPALFIAFYSCARTHIALDNLNFVLLTEEYQALSDESRSQREKDILCAHIPQGSMQEVNIPHDIRQKIMESYGTAKVTIFKQAQMHVFKLLVHNSSDWNWRSKAASKVAKGKQLEKLVASTVDNHVLPAAMYFVTGVLQEPTYDNMKKSIVIIGGGVTGVLLAKKLCRELKRSCSIVLVDKKNYFSLAQELVPIWFQTSRQKITEMSQSFCVSYSKIFNGAEDLSFVKGTVRRITSKKVLVSSTTLPYDYLVIAPGLSFGKIPRNIYCSAPTLDSDVHEQHSMKPLPITDSTVLVVVGSGPTALSTLGHALHNFPNNRIILVNPHETLDVQEKSVDSVTQWLKDNKIKVYFSCHLVSVEEYKNGNSNGVGSINPNGNVSGSGSGSISGSSKASTKVKHSRIKKQEDDTDDDDDDDDDSENNNHNKVLSPSKKSVGNSDKNIQFAIPEGGTTKPKKKQPKKEGESTDSDETPQTTPTMNNKRKNGKGKSEKSDLGTSTPQMLAPSSTGSADMNSVVIFPTNEIVHPALVFWCEENKPGIEFMQRHFSDCINSKGFVQVDEFFQLVSKDLVHRNVFSIGNACQQSPEELPDKDINVCIKQVQKLADVIKVKIKGGSSNKPWRPQQHFAEEQIIELGPKFGIFVTSGHVESVGDPVPKLYSAKLLQLREQVTSEPINGFLDRFSTKKQTTTKKEVELNYQVLIIALSDLGKYVARKCLSDGIAVKLGVFSASDEFTSNPMCTVHIIDFSDTNRLKLMLKGAGLIVLTLDATPKLVEHAKSLTQLFQKCESLKFLVKIQSQGILSRRDYYRKSSHNTASPTNNTHMSSSLSTSSGAQENEKNSSHEEEEDKEEGDERSEESQEVKSEENDSDSNISSASDPPPSSAPVPIKAKKGVRSSGKKSANNTPTPNLATSISNVSPAKAPSSTSAPSTSNATSPSSSTSSSASSSSSSTTSPFSVPDDPYRVQRWIIETDSVFKKANLKCATIKVRYGVTIDTLMETLWQKSLRNEKKFYVPGTDFSPTWLSRSDIVECVVQIIHHPKKYENKDLVITGAIKVKPKKVAKIFTEVVNDKISYEVKSAQECEQILATQMGKSNANIFTEWLYDVHITDNSAEKFSDIDEKPSSVVFTMLKKPPMSVREWCTLYMHLFV